MSAPRPLEVYEALEEEYVSMFGELPPPPSAAITAEQIVDAAAATATLKAHGLTDGDDLVKTLEKLQITDAAHDAFRNAEQLSPVTRVLLDDWKHHDEDTRRVLSRRILDEVFVGSLRPFRDIRLAALYREIAEPSQERCDDLCLLPLRRRRPERRLRSRRPAGASASRILNKFDYLSTVGGGSYIGSWLSA